MAGYGSDAGFEEYAEANGYTVPEDGDIAAARQRGSAYIDAAYGDRFPGSPVDGIEQEREWPREDAEDIYGNSISSSSVPSRVVHASYEAALLELENPGSLSAVLTENERIRRMKAGSVEIEFAESKAYTSISGAYPMSTKINGLLYPLLGRSTTDRPIPGILVV
jgi:hypothetical protein